MYKQFIDKTASLFVLNQFNQSPEKFNSKKEFLHYVFKHKLVIGFNFYPRIK